MINIKQTLKRNIDINTAKLNRNIVTDFYLPGVLGGFFIGIGGIASHVATALSAEAVIFKFIGPMLFSIGLIMIILLGMELFTGDLLVINVIAASKKDAKIAEAIGFLFSIYVSNFFGAIMASDLAYMAGIYNRQSSMIGATVINSMMNKLLTTNGVQVIGSGIFCNILVIAAVLFATSAESIVGKIIGIAVPITTFVFCGFDHCIANIYNFGALAFCLEDEECVNAAIQTFGYTKEQLTYNTDILVAGSKLIGFSTLGNIIGGLIFSIMLLISNNFGEDG